MLTSLFGGLDDGQGVEGRERSTGVEGGRAADAFPLSPVIDFISGSQQFSARFPEAELLLPPLVKKLSFKDVADDAAGAPPLSEGSTS